MDPGLETDGSVRPQGGARVRTRVERLPSRLCAVAGARQSEGWGLQVFGEGSPAGLNGGASEGPGGFPEAQLPVPGCRGQRWTVQTCLTCQRSQRFLNDPGHVLWGDQPEAHLGSQADSKPPQSVPNTSHLIEEKVQPQSSNNQ
ncbi:ribonuclease P protein subunit p21 isoform X2 [Artibeus jamaicensis]|uniref:ribonuclease P protein subunit p21 isoform X2 n=1 Tax=Artibeus jamaicensis TaxID=9417 RepID=UPI00235AF4A5|nr:ribonuclease P protein subunit p21 isoform X2 [Artibeus jamaicensis]